MTGKFSLFLPTVLYRYVTCPESTTLHHQSSNKPQPWVPFSGLVRVAWPIYLAYELYTLIKDAKGKDLMASSIASHSIQTVMFD